MATTAISSSTGTTTATNGATTAAQTAAANKAAAQSLISSLSAGSGVDVAALAQNLVNAERVPQENAINAKITKNEARISGMSAISYVVSQLQTAVTALKDQNSFASLTASSSTSAFSATAGATALAGSYDVNVVSLAKSQRSISGGFATAATSLNGGSGLSLTLKLGDTTGIAPLVKTQQGSAGTTEFTAVSFTDMVAGQTVTVGGLTYTATTNTTIATSMGTPFVFKCRRAAWSYFFDDQAVA